MSRSRKIGLLASGSGSYSKDDRQFVESLDRGLRVLRAFNSSRDALANGELARRTNLSKSTISRLTYTLARLGYLNHDSDSGRYRLGPGVLALGNTSLSDFDVRRIARPLMQKLAECAPGGVVLCARIDHDMICLEIRRSPQYVGLGLEVGDRSPLALTAAGRAYLAALPPAERASLLQTLSANTPRWPSVVGKINKTTEEVAERGFCVEVGDWVPEINSVAVPLRVKTPYGLLTVNVGGLASLLPVRRMEKDLGPRLVSLARRVEERLRT